MSTDFYRAAHSSADGSLTGHLLNIGGYDREKAMSLLDPDGG